MHEGLTDFHLGILKVQRTEISIAVAHLVATMYETAGKSYQSAPKAKDIFDRLSGTVQPPDDDETELPSLAKLKAERAAREANGEKRN